MHGRPGFEARLDTCFQWGQLSKRHMIIMKVHGKVLKLHVELILLTKYEYGLIYKHATILQLKGWEPEWSNLQI